MNEIERERWRGSVDAELRGLIEDVKTLFRVHKELGADMQKLEILITALTGNVATLAMKIGLLSGIGAVIGAAATQYVLSILKH